MTELFVVKVFADAEGGFGNPLGVVLDGTAVPPEQRGPLATSLGFSETVVVDDLARAVCSIHTPDGGELPFAGHPMVGLAWLLARETGDVPEVLCPPAGEVATWVEGGATWVRARPEWAPPWEQVRLDAAERVAALTAAPDGHDFVQLWAWQDEEAGTVRARVFAPRVGVAEDEACGSASLLLAHRTGRALRIDHGDGSVVLARPGPEGTAEIGGAVVLAERRDLTLVQAGR